MVVIRHAFIQPDPHKRSNLQTVAGAPCDAVLGIDPLKILTDDLDVFVELLLVQNLTQPLAKRMICAYLQRCSRRPQPLRPAPFLS